MKTMKTVSILLVLFLGAFVYYSLHVDAVDTKKEEERKPLIALSTYALYDAAKNIAGESMECFCVLPEGVEVHDFEPTPKIMAKLHDSALVVYSGAGLEPWTHTFENEKNGLDMSGYMRLLDAASHHDEEEEEEDGHHHESESDPHYWLDTDNMIKAASVLREKFTKLLPQNEELYRTNADAYIAKLKEIDARYREKMLTCKIDTIVVDHNAFSYLAEKYGFHVESVSGLSPDAEPSAKVMGKIIEKVQDKNITTIFFESFASDKVINAIAADTNVKVDMLQPIANITKEELQNGSTYYSLMMQNLEKIAKARECR